MRGEAALALQDDLPLLLLSAAALPVLRQCGLITVYRCTHQCGERSNAAFDRQSAAVLPSLAPHDSKARLQLVTRRRDSWRSHVHRTRLRSACSYSSCKLPMSGVEGPSPRPFSWGCKGDILFLRKRISPFAASPHGVGPEAALPRCTLPAPYGRKKKQPSRAAFLPRPRRESCPNCQYGILIPISPLFSLDNMQY